MRQNITRRNLLAAALVAVPAQRLFADSFATASAQANDTKSSGPIRLIANENPYGPSAAARKAASEGVAEGWQYAFAEGAELKRQIAEFHGVTPEHVIVTAGSGEALKIAALAFCQDGGRMLSAHPTFNLITSYAESLGCVVDRVPLDSSMTHDLPAMAAAVVDDTKLIYICNPNNPTGTLLDPKALDDFISNVSARAPVVVDEAYLDLHVSAAKHSAIARVIAGEPVVVMRTFSKIHGMAGLRIGYAIARPDDITRFESLRMSFLNRPGVLAASASFGDTEFLQFSREKIRECMAITTNVLEELGRPYTPSFGNFVLFDTGGSVDEFAAAMRQSNILTGRSEPAYPGWARVSMGRVEQMELFADAARRYFS